MRAMVHSSAGEKVMRLLIPSWCCRSQIKNARAEEALSQIGKNSIGLAME